MPKKLDSGDYRCKYCGNIYDRHKSAVNHEKTCFDSDIRKFIDQREKTVSKMVDIDVNKFKPSESKQLKIGESYVGRCGNCKTILTTRNRFKKESELFECPKCENVLANN